MIKKTTVKAILFKSNMYIWGISILPLVSVWFICLYEIADTCKPVA
ncbi:hypothetical protein [Bacillus sp. ISL-45]|nr:hypothetical protein [Bacillus sp. ISL-45]